jgi:hypothetical protein
MSFKQLNPYYCITSQTSSLHLVILIIQDKVSLIHFRRRIKYTDTVLLLGYTMCQRV